MECLPADVKSIVATKIAENYRERCAHALQISRLIYTVSHDEQKKKIIIDNLCTILYKILIFSGMLKVVQDVLYKI